MSKIIKSGTIKNLDSNTNTIYQIEHGLNAQFTVQAQLDWVKFNLTLVDFINKQSKNCQELQKNLERHRLEDVHWNWIDKSFYLNTQGYEWFYFIAGNKVQGICCIYHPKPSKLDNENIFYVEYVAIAPWNRLNDVCPKQFNGIGTLLIKTALDYSVSVLGYRHGFSLHSLPQSEEYYKKIGMKNFGKDLQKQNLSYFEMTLEDAQRFAYEK